MLVASETKFNVGERIADDERAQEGLERREQHGGHDVHAESEREHLAWARSAVLAASEASGEKCACFNSGVALS